MEIPFSLHAVAWCDDILLIKLEWRLCKTSRKIFTPSMKQRLRWPLPSGGVLVPKPSAPVMPEESPCIWNKEELKGSQRSKLRGLRYSTWILPAMDFSVMSL